MAKKKTEAQVQFEADTSGFSQGIKEADNSLKTLRKELNLNSAELKENAEDVDLLAKRKKLLQQEADESAKKVENLENKLKSAKQLFGDSSQEVYQLQNKLIDAKTEFQKIQNEISQTDSKLSSLESGLNDTEQELNQVDQATDNASEGFTTLKGAMADLLADGIQAVAEGLKDLAVDSDTAMSNFQAQTGLSSEKMGEFETVMEDIYSKNFGDSINDIANSMAQVKQQTKETDPTKLQQMTENALVLRDTFDFDVAESMRAVNSLMNQFGLDSDEAFNLVVQGAQNGLNANGDMLDVINEYSVQYKNAGYSADEMFNMLYSGAEEGTWSIDKMGDAMKEFNIRMSDGTVAKALDDHGIKIDNLSERYGKGGESAKEVMSEVMTAIMGVEDETDRYNLGVQVMGTMFEDLGEDTVKAMMKSEGSIDSTKKSMEELTEVKMNNITTQIGEIGRMIETDFLIPIAEKLLPIVKDGIKWVGDNLNWLLPVITGIGIAFATYFAVAKIMSIINTVKTLVTLVRTGTTVMGALNTVMSLNPVALVVAGIVGLIATFVLLWNKCDAFRNFWINLWNKIKSVGSTAIEGMKNKFTQFKDHIGNIKDRVVNTFTNLKNSVTNTFNKVKTAITNPIESAKNKVKSVVDKIKSFFKFNVSLPKIKLPHFSISPKGWKIGDLLKGSIPKLGISWYAKGGIFTKPTIFANGNNATGVGEAGAEAVLPIDRLESWINSGFSQVASNNYYADEKIERLIEVAEALLEKDTNLYVNGRNVSEELGPTNDEVSGTRVNLKKRGLAI